MNDKIERIIDQIDELHPVLEKGDFYKRLKEKFGDDLNKYIVDGMVKNFKEGLREDIEFKISEVIQETFEEDL